MNPPRLSLPLILKLAAAGVTGSAAALTFARIRREEAVAAQTRDLRDAVLLLGRRSGDGPSPPVILVAGFRGGGKSAFVNTACRALAGEEGPLLLRAETAPPGPAPAGVGPLSGRAVPAAVVTGDCGGEEGEPEEAPVVEMVEATSLPEAGRMTRADVKLAIAGSGGSPDPECVVIVLRCGGPQKEWIQAVRKLSDVASVVRESGLHLVVVLTHKKAVRTRKQAEELQREVAFRARTDCVYFIENYTASDTLNISHPPAIKNNFETHFTALAILRQCVEFVKIYRGHLSRQQRPKSSDELLMINEP